MDTESFRGQRGAAFKSVGPSTEAGVFLLMANPWLGSDAELQMRKLAEEPGPARLTGTFRDARPLSPEPPIIPILLKSPRLVIAAIIAVANTCIQSVTRRRAKYRPVDINYRLKRLSGIRKQLEETISLVDVLS